MSREASGTFQTFRRDTSAGAARVDQGPAFECCPHHDHEDRTRTGASQELGAASGTDSLQGLGVEVEYEREKAAEQAFEFVRNGDVFSAKALIEKYKLDVNAPECILESAPENGSSQDLTKFDTLMHIAAVKADEHFVQYLIEKGADKGSINEDGLTPFHVAILNGNVPVARFFLSRRTKAEDDYCSSKASPHRCTLLQLAIASSSQPMMELVLNDATVHDVLMCWQQTSSVHARSILETKRGFFPPENGATLSKHAAAEEKKAERLVKERSQVERIIIKNKVRAKNRKKDVAQMRRRTKKIEWRTKLERQELHERRHCEAQVLKIDKRKRRKAKGGGNRAGGKGGKGTAKRNVAEERRRGGQGKKNEQSRRGEEQERKRTEEARRRLEAWHNWKAEEMHPKPRENQWELRENSAAYLRELMERKRREAELREERLSRARVVAKELELPSPLPQPPIAGKKSSKKSKRSKKNPEASRLQAEEQARRESVQEDLIPASKPNLVGLKASTSTKGRRPPAQRSAPLQASTPSGEAKALPPNTKSKHKANSSPEVTRDNARHRGKKEKQGRAKAVAKFWAS